MTEKIDGFMELRVSTLGSENALPMDVYLPVRTKAVRFVARGDRLDLDKVFRLKSHRIRKLFLKKEDVAKFSLFLEEGMASAESNELLTPEERASGAAAYVEFQADRWMENLADGAAQEKALKSFARYFTFLHTVPRAAGLILKGGKTMGCDFLSHEAQVATLGFLMVKALGRDFGDQGPAFITGCFLHDVAIRQSDVEDPDAHRMSETNRDGWLKHPEAGAKLLASISLNEKIFPLVMDIVTQHEEVPTGKGFPKGLDGAKLSHFVLAASLANRYSRHCTEHQFSHAKAMQSFMKTEAPRYETPMAELVRKVVGEMLQ